MTDSINYRVRVRRQELGLSDVEMAKLAGLAVDQYFDVEAHADEFETVLTLKEARHLCQALQLDLFDLIGLEDGDQTEGRGPRNEIVARQRRLARLSREELADAIGFDEEVVVHLEEDPDYLDTWSIELITSLAKILGISPGVLIRKGP